MFRNKLFLSFLFLSYFLINCHSMKHHSSCHKHKGDHHKTSCKGKKTCSSKKHCKKCRKSKCDKGVLGKANVMPLQAGGPKGFVTFEKSSKKKILVKASITNLKPQQKFGFHIHEFGDCSLRALKAGGHLSYHKHSQHGGPSDSKKHLGDLGNLSSDSKGQASYEQVVKGHVKYFLGRSIIIHEKEDDLKSQPSGNSGKRIACGIIGVSLKEAPAPKAAQPQETSKK